MAYIFSPSHYVPPQRGVFNLSKPILKLFQKGLQGGQTEFNAVHLFNLSKVLQLE